MYSVTISFVGLMIVIYLITEWYQYESMLFWVDLYEEEEGHEVKWTVVNEEKPTDSSLINYGELYGDEAKQIVQKRKASIQVSNIEGTEAEGLLSSLQKELDTADLDEEMLDSTREDTSANQARTEYLQSTLNSIAENGTQSENLEDMVMMQHELYQLQNRQADLNQLEKDYGQFFQTDESNSFNDEDVLKIEDMDVPKVDCEKKRYATALITDNELGEQRWRGKVVGKEGEFIHFFDGSKRAWIYAGSKKNSISIGDELLLDVYRDPDEITIENLFRLKRPEAVAVAQAN